LGPLEDVRVVELSTGIAGPVAGMLLADYGAEVVKVEPPAGDPARALPGFAVWNRNKQSVVVDARSSHGRQRLAELLEGADLCIYADAAQIDDASAAANPGLIRLFMPPYTPDGTPWAGGAESHELLAAIGGLSSRQSSFDGGPIHLVYPFALYEQGVWAAACAVAALVERQRSGAGQTVTVAGIHGVLACSPGSFALDPTQPPLPTNIGAGGRHPCYTTFKCKDGKWLFMAALTPKFQANAFKVLGVGNLFADPRIDGVSSRLVLPENRGWVKELLMSAFLTRTRDEWLELLEIGDCPAGPMYDRDAWLDHPQIEANGLRAEVDDPERGHVVMPGLCIGLAKTPGAVRGPAPRLGEHDATAGRWTPRESPPPPAPPSLPPWGPISPRHCAGEGSGPPVSLSPPPCRGEAAQPRDVGAADICGAAPPMVGRGGGRGVGDSRGPLAGVRALDLGTILAGPYAGTLLAGLGADVVKVEAPAGDAFREPGFVYNRGMRGLAIDLSRPAGQQAFHRLVKTADVVIDNSRLGVSKRLRVDYATLAEVNPRVITLSVAGFGEHGPYAHKPAFDPVLQAMSGMMTAQGGDGDPGFYTIPVNDVVAAVTAVLAVCLGLYHRGQSGEGQRTWTSLVASSLTMQSGELVRYEGRPPAQRGGRDFVGPSPAERFYQTADGWVRVQAPGLAAVGEALGLARPHLNDPDAVADALAVLPVAAALERLNGAGVPAAPARHTTEVARDPAIAAVGLLEEHHFPSGQPYLIPSRYARFSRTEQAPLADAPGIGEHSREVLAEAGLSPAEVDALVQENVVVEGSPFVLQALVNYR
jgi:crotonobetainyl-CoA:carnitine CoA-transferase CaiB-like acyl-CoA transferase